MDFIFIRKPFIFYFLFCMLVSCSNDKATFLGAVSSATPEASLAGKEIFLKGGNAIDAAVAISFALGVTEPAMSGLGGGTQVLLSLNNKTPFAINGTTISPKNTPRIMGDTLTYHRRSSIPSTVKVLDYIWRKYGSGLVTWEELLAPAIQLAEKGFIVGEFRAKVYKKYERKLMSSNYNTSFFLTSKGEIPLVGQRLKQPLLGQTLRRLATNGASDFYQGTIANEIADDMKQNGGWITLDDLKNFEAPKELPALQTTYKGHEVFSQPPPCGGWTTLLILNLLEQLSQNGPLTNQDLISALYLAHTDRNKNPLYDLQNYQELVANKLTKEYAKELLMEGLPLNSAIGEEYSGETTHFSVVDTNGNAIAVTSSINAYFGAVAASENLGFLYNTYMDDFIFENPEHPFAIGPKKMAYSSMSPSIIQRNGINMLILGSPGSARIISTVAQISAKWIEDNHIDSLIASSRIHVSKQKLYLENANDSLKIDNSILNKHHLKYSFPDESLMIKKQLNPYYGGVHAIARENENWIGVADPRRDGEALLIYEKNK